jgi:hypothetical protein
LSVSRNALIAFVLAAGVAALYAPAVWFDFVLLDDPSYVVENPQVMGGLTWPGVVWAFTTFYKGYWIPLTWLSYMADVSVGGTGPAMFHATNIALHAANVVLVFGVLVRLTKSTWKSAVVAALFAAHPLHVESVAWVTERKDVLSTFFVLLSVHLYVSYAAQSRTLTYTGMAGCFVLSLMAKPMMVTLPALLALLDIWPLARWRVGRRRALVVEKLPLVAVAIAFAILTVVTQRNAGALADLNALPIGSRLGFAVLGYGAFLWRLVWPAGLNALYAFPEPLPVGWTVTAGLVLAGVSIAAVRSVRTRPYLTVGWFWFLLAMAPVSGVLQVGQQWTADRFAYVPFIGLYVAIVWLTAPVVARVRFGAVATSVAVIIAAAVATRSQLGYWQNGLVLWSRILATGGDAVRGNLVLGYEMSRAGRREAAIEHFEAVLQLQPDNAEAKRRLAVVHADLADSLERAGRIDEALEHYRGAVRFAPEAAEVQNNFGALLASQGRVAEALPHFESAVRRLPRWEAARLNYAVALTRAGQSAEAIRQFEEVLRINPSNGVARRALGR